MELPVVACKLVRWRRVRRRAKRGLEDYVDVFVDQRALAAFDKLCLQREYLVKAVEEEADAVGRNAVYEGMRWLAAWRCCWRPTDRASVSSQIWGGQGRGDTKIPDQLW